MSLSAQARKLLDHLPDDGSKVGGITLQRELSLSKLEYQKARDELKERALVVSGQGRGGSLAKILDAEPLQEDAKPSKTQIMEFAREAKQAKSREQKEIDKEISLIAQYFKDHHGYTIKRRSDISFSEGRPVVAVWKGSRAQMYAIPLLEWDKLRAEYRA